MSAFDLYDGKDPRTLPLYSVRGAAFLLALHPATLRTWIYGRARRGGEGGTLEPLIQTPLAGRLSFVNLTEAHVLAAIRRRHGVPLPKVRQALDFIKRRNPTSLHPLVEEDFETNGVDLFVRHFEGPVNASRGGQMAIKEVIEVHLHRIARDDSGLPVRLFPFVRTQTHSSLEALRDDPKTIVVDPAMSFGQPILSGTNISTQTLISRFRAGDSIIELADDFELKSQLVEDAIRYEAKAA